ncbi:hypothetical protein BAUCODRAFT_483952 [Baudoinia panamericana UAMH 10762]|uniref:Zn(2)-C6 fungal-type domain-containing protein n=1 Tax=Baudoinia panamericana (strain UAMH 10762) TaxID=717646 RepID=M2MYF7_BAUPA|nr:uncharacterized protein BAUCODRAFT_483952 [Baudoinia panamericana UAMH 10762]EMC96618.1 hypothetical protein BAUCODRAFT_483952 [Baudoinia panamericana UAMH 10762]
MYCCQSSPDLSTIRKDNIPLWFAGRDGHVKAMEAADGPSTMGLIKKRVCDACRTRKVRCDRGSPCSPCRAANLTCRTEKLRTKVTKQRVQVSKQYETKIDTIDQRLAIIEQLLRQQSTNTVCSASGRPTTASSHAVDGYLPHGAATPLSIIDDNISTQKPATGYIGAPAESLAAMRVLDRHVMRDPMIQHDTELLSALESLRDIVDRTQQDSCGPSRNCNTTQQSHTVPDCVHPGPEQVEALLKKAESARPVMFHLLPPGLFHEFCRKCRLMYERRQEGSPTDKLLVFAGLTNISSEFTAEGDQTSVAYHHSLVLSFSALLLSTLATLPLLMPASVENLEALLMAILTLIGLCKPSLSWSLICKAAQLCQKLCLNRLYRHDTRPDPDFNRKIMLFWSIYIMDRNIAFRLGHAPAIQDYDIDTPLLMENDACPLPVVELMIFWIDCARIQGKICTQLYGPAASDLAPEDRVRVALTLADELERIHQRKGKANSTMLEAESCNRTNTRIQDPWIHSDDIMFNSTLTTALYAVPSTHPGRLRAIESARQCLRISRDLANRYLHNVHNWTVCCHWASSTTSSPIHRNHKMM